MTEVRQIMNKLMNPCCGCNKNYKPTFIEQVANCITHGMFIPSSLYLLFKFHTLSRTFEEEMNAWVYGMSLIILYGVSTAYHLLCFTKKTKMIEMLRISDHATIYMFIAASYTPWLTLTDYNINSSLYIIPLWSIAIFGIIFSFIYKAKEHHEFELIVYVCEGVLPAIFLIAQVGFDTGMRDLALGGAWVLSGILFFRLDGKLPFAHAIWHIFVYLATYYHSRAFMNLLIERNSLSESNIMSMNPLMEVLGGN